MMRCVQKTLCLATSLLLAQVLLVTSTATIRRPQPLEQEQEQHQYHEQPEPHSVITCRVTTMHTMYEADGEEGSNVDHREEHACIPIVNGTETAFTRTVEFPESIKTEHAAKIAGGKLHISIHGAHVNHYDGAVVMRYDANFTIHEEAPRPTHKKKRNLLAYDDAIGSRKLTIYRVSTYDSTPKYSATHIENALFKGSNCLKTQYEACSGGKMTWTSGGVHDVTLPGPIANYKSGQAVQDAAIEHMGFTYTLQEKGDNIIFVTPPGIKYGFIAFAGVNWYISNFSDRWVNDLRAVAHELGHNLALNHAAYNGQPYGDHTGYMAATGGQDTPTGPRMCFNGYNTFQLGWYEDETMTYHPSSDGGRRVKLTSIVDAKKATAAEPVVIEINGKQLYLQYNEKRAHNNGVELMPNMVTITHLEDSTTSKTDLRAGLNVGQSYSEGGVKIQACSRSTTGPTRSMTVGIGTSSTANVCGLPLYVDRTPATPEKPDKRNPYFTPPSTGYPRRPVPGVPGNTKTCNFSANNKVSYRFGTTEISNKKCGDIPADQRLRICKKQNVAKENMFQRVFDVCQNECPPYTGCGLPLTHFDKKPRRCAQEGRGRVKFKFNGVIENRKCKSIRQQGREADVCELPVISNVFAARHDLRVYNVCENVCDEYAKCSRGARSRGAPPR